MTKRDLDPMLGRAIFADGVGTVVATSVGGSPTTTYAENIGVMAATRVYSTAAYYVAAIVAILLGLCPKFGALVAADPGRRARRDHGDPLRDDRPARREDLEGEPGRLRQPDQPGAAGRRDHHRDRQRDAGVQRRPSRCRASRSARSSPSSAGTSPGSSPRRRCGEALTREAGYYGGTGPGDRRVRRARGRRAGADYESPDPSSVDRGRAARVLRARPGEDTLNR